MTKMNITNRLSQTIPPQFRTLAKRISYFILGTVLTVFYAQIVHAQSAGSNAPVSNPYLIPTIIAAIIAL
jgi:branched-subunit amino acid transport protein